MSITQVPLHVLRSHMAIIAQDPVLFAGTIRFNLDPTNSSDDVEIWRVLKIVCGPVLV